MRPCSNFAFLVHPRVRIADDLARVWGRLGRVPEPVYDAALRRLPLRPVTMATVEIGGHDVGHVVMVPFGARHMLERPGQARSRVSAAVDRAVRLGADVVGLGALTATVTAGGAALRGRTDIGVTNGNAFTAAIVESQARSLLDAADLVTGRDVAVVGATGSVGSAVVGLLARDGATERLTLVARSRPRLDALAKSYAGCARIDVAADLAALREADLVVLLTASAECLIGPEHLKPGAVVLDATQPRNTSPDLLIARPDVVVVDGGIVAVPTLRLRGGDIGLPNGRAYACFAETALLALSGHRGHFAVGTPTLDQVDDVRALAAEHGSLGFRAAQPTSFGRPLSLGAAARPITNAMAA